MVVVMGWLESALSTILCVGTKNRTREDGGGYGLVGIDPFAYFMRGYE